jgi:hypothetical protein
MPNRWDEQYSKWLRTRASYIAMLPAPKDPKSNPQFVEAERRYGCESEALERTLGPVIRRAAARMMGSFPTQIEAQDLIGEFYLCLYRSPPLWLSEWYIAKALRNRAIDQVREIRRANNIVSIEQDREGEKKQEELIDRAPPEDWPWFESLPEPSRGYGALFSHIQRFVDISQADSFAQTGWFSGVSGESVRSNIRRAADWELDPVQSANSRAGRVPRAPQKVPENLLYRLNAEMLGAHSALTVFFRALCAKAISAPQPFSEKSFDTMSLVIQRAPDKAVAQWVIACLSGAATAVPEDLAKSAEKVLRNEAGADDVRYLLECVSLYVRAYSILILPEERDDGERHWTEISAPMTPRETAFHDYRRRAKGYPCLENYLPKLLEMNHAN